jgi:hypothetical protein
LGFGFFFVGVHASSTLRMVGGTFEGQPTSGRIISSLQQ